MAQSLDANLVQGGLQVFQFYDVMIVFVGRTCLLHICSHGWEVLPMELHQG